MVHIGFRYVAIFLLVLAWRKENTSKMEKLWKSEVDKTSWKSGYKNIM